MKWLPVPVLPVRTVTLTISYKLKQRKDGTFYFSDIQYQRRKIRKCHAPWAFVLTVDSRKK